MGNLKIPIKYESKKILVVDDERPHITFLIEYLQSKGYEVTYAANVADAFSSAEKCKFRAYFIDLNIPVGEGVILEHVNETYVNYRGLYVMKAVRSQGISGARVLAYSAHFNDSIVEEVKRLYCKYVVKGRARELKQAFDVVLERDPLEQEEQS